MAITHPFEGSTADDSLPGPSEIQRHFNIETSECQVLLVGKDGGVKERRHEKVQPADFFDCIDAMPMRKAELRNKRQR